MGRTKPPPLYWTKGDCPSLLPLLGVSSKWWGPAAPHAIHNPLLSQTGLGRGQPFLDASFLSFLRSHFSHVPQNAVVPAEHLNRLILFLSTHPTLPSLCSRCIGDMGTAQIWRWHEWCFLPLTYYFPHNFWQMSLFLWFDWHFCTLIWLIVLTPTKHRGSVFR